jgi:hypothetical protein
MFFNARLQRLRAVLRWMNQPLARLRPVMGEAKEVERFSDAYQFTCKRSASPDPGGDPSGGRDASATLADLLCESSRTAPISGFSRIEIIETRTWCEKFQRLHEST